MSVYDWYLCLRDGGCAKVMQMKASAADKSSTQAELDFALSSAVGQRDVEFVAFLLSHGAQIDENGFLAATRQKSLAIYQEFLRHGWDINSRTPSGTAVRLVVSDTELVRWFLDHGANHNLAGLPRRTNCASWGLPFLPLLATIVNRNWETVELLLSRGCEVDDTAMVKCLDSVEGDDISKLEYLVERGGNANARWHGVVPLIIRGDNVRPPEIGISLLHLAVERNNSAVISLLIKKGAEVHARSQRGHTSADVAEEEGQQEILGLLQKADRPAGAPSP